MTDTTGDTAEYDVTSEFDAGRVADQLGPNAARCTRHPERKATHAVQHPDGPVRLCRACTAELRHAATITPNPDAARAEIKEL